MNKYGQRNHLERRNTNGTDKKGLRKSALLLFKTKLFIKTLDYAFVSEKQVLVDLITGNSE